MLLAAGLVVALLLAALLVAAAVMSVRAPFRALGVLVAGMAVHNVVLMLLLTTHVPDLVVRVLQVWKEALLALLGLIVLVRLVQALRQGRRPRLVWPDYAAAALAVLLVAYVVLPRGGPLTQRAFDFRTLGTIPLLYVYGRVFWPPGIRDLRWTMGMVIGSAALVGAVGLVELWFVPTATWLALGVNQFNLVLGHVYHGPGGLPPNFFQTTPTDVLLRRMVSTYISPLGIAYTALLVVPVAAAWWAERRGRRAVTIAASACLALVLLSVLFSLTRLAMGLTVLELGLMALLMPRRRTWALVPAMAVCVVLVLFGYLYVGPTLTRDLRPIREPAGYALLRGHEPRSPVPVSPRPTTRPGASPRPTPVPGGLVSSNDPSLLEHLRSLRADARLLLANPLGAGLGTFVPRFEAQGVTGESAVFWIVAELGVLGGIAYAALYLALLIGGALGLRAARGDTWEVRAVPLIALVGGLALIPITLTSDLWGDLSVTFLLWWVAGAAVSLGLSSRQP